MLLTRIPNLNHLSGSLLAQILLIIITVTGSPIANAQSRAYCAVEIGSKGVKGRAFEFGVKDADTSVRVDYSKDINTTIIASMKDGEFSANGIADTADAVASMIKEMRERSPNCRAFAVGSSGIAGAKNRDALSTSINQRVEIGELEFITAEKEAEYGLMSSVPKKDLASSVFIDIGSSNTKIGYMSEGKLRAAEVPFGTTSLTSKVATGGADFNKALNSMIDANVRPSIRDAASRAPGMMNRRKIYWIGGAAWSTATFMRPDQQLRAFVRMDRTDVKRFIASLNDKTWINYKPSNKASNKTKEQWKKDSDKVVEIFTRDNLLAGSSLFDAFLNDRGVDGPIIFARNGQWIMGYAQEKYGDDIWSEENTE